jgi:voltage-gated sodium channel
MIILCSILLGFDTFFRGQEVIFEIIDDLFTVFFAFEIIVRLVSYSNPLHFFKLLKFSKKEGIRFEVDESAFWNCFDFTIVFVSVIGLFSHVFEHPEFLIVSRLFRVLRVLRLLEVSESLRAVEKKIISIIPTIFSFGLLLAILLYIYSIIGIYLFGHTDFGRANFSTIISAFMSLFQVMTLDGWSDLMNEVSMSRGESWVVEVYFISFVLLTAIVSFNVFVAVLTSQVHERVIEDQKLNQGNLKRIEGEIHEATEEVEAGMTEIARELKEIRKELAELRSRQAGS